MANIIPTNSFTLGAFALDGNRIRELLASEAKSLFETYRQFEKLIPAENTKGSAHNAEDGRFVEDLLREFLRKHLPKELEVLTGFILRPAVKQGKALTIRKGETDTHSSQLDIIVYDSAHYPIVQQFGESVIVIPEGVIGIISVKKTLRKCDIIPECKALRNAAELCRDNLNSEGNKIRGPYLAIIGFSSDICPKRTSAALSSALSAVEDAFKEIPEPTFDALIGFVGALNRWSIFKTRPQKDKRINKYPVVFIGYEHDKHEDFLGLQFLLTGLLSVYYDPTRNSKLRPGFTAFQSERSPSIVVEDILSVEKLR